MKRQSLRMAFRSKGKLQDDFKDTKIVNFPDREILPYDHFSTPDLILKQRVNAINSFEEYLSKGYKTHVDEVQYQLGILYKKTKIRRVRG